MKAVFHSSPGLTRMRLNALRRSNLVKTVAFRSCTNDAGTRGRGYGNLRVWVLRIR